MFRSALSRKPTKISTVPSGQAGIKSVPKLIQIRKPKMIITNPENKKIKQYHGQILTISIVLSLMIFTWELATFRGVLSYWVLVPLTVGTYLIDTPLEIPLMTR